MNRVPRVRLYRRPDSSCWWFSYVKEGVRLRDSTGLTEQDAAERFRKALQAALTNEHYGLAPPEPEVCPTFGHVVGRYLKEALDESRCRAKHRQMCTDRLRRFLDAFGEEAPVDGVTADKIDAWKRTRMRENRLNSKTPRRISPTTVRNELRALRACLRWAADRGLLPRAPKFDLPQGKTHRPGIIPAEHARAILDGLDLDNPLHRGVYLALWTGLRPEDLKALTWAAFDFKAATLSLRSQKNDQPIRVPLHASALKALDPYRKAGAPVCAVPDSHACRRLTRRLCGEPYYLRQFRSSMAHHLAATGTEIMLVKVVLGHATDDVTLGYVQANPGILKAAVDRLPWAPRPDGVVTFRSRALRKLSKHGA